MKKLSLFVLGVLFFSQATAVLAATSIEPAIGGLLKFNRWLHADNFSGAAYINDNLQQTFGKALEWDRNAVFSYLEVGFPSPRCSFEFISANKPGLALTADCVDLKTQTIQSKIVPLSEARSGTEAFNFPARKLRDFVSNIFTNTAVLRDIRATMNQSSRSDVFFTLQKVNGEIRWNWEVVDTNKQFGMDVHANAMDLNSPVTADKK